MKLLPRISTDRIERGPAGAVLARLGLYGTIWPRFCDRCDRPTTSRHRHAPLPAHVRRAIEEVAAAVTAAAVAKVRREESAAALMAAKRKRQATRWAEPVIDASDPAVIKVDLAGCSLPAIPQQYRGSSS